MRSVALSETTDIDAAPCVQEELNRFRHKAEETQQRLVDFLATTSDITWELDANLRVTSSLDPPNMGIHGNPYLPGKTVPEVVGGDPSSDRGLAAHMEDLACRRPFRGFVFSVAGRSGKLSWLETNGNPIFSKHGVFQGYRGTTRDITRRKTDEERISWLDSYDRLTHLPNRVLFRERLQESLALMRPETFLAVLVLDLDNFKMTNDTLGHAIGDSLLSAVGERLSSAIRHRDTVGRVGGDEFAIVQTDLDDPGEAGAFARRIGDLVSQPFEIAGHRIVASVTIGIALAGPNDIDAEQILKNANIALSVAKVGAPGSWRYFKPEMAESLEARRSLESDLRNAMENEEFELFYQPFYLVESLEICAFEALVRWRHPRRGMVMPDQFIPIAEETGLIVPLGEWILREACMEASTWPEHISVAVNLSAAQFRDASPLKAVTEALAAAGLPPGRLELEITETVLMQDGEAALSALHELRGLGTRISMDDFGTGYSSLSYLRSFPFDKIKIDRSFIRDLTQKRGGVAIVRAIALLGTSLRLATTAEGIETTEQFEIVRAEGCTEVQGFLFSHPRPANELPALMGIAEPETIGRQCGPHRPCIPCRPRSVASPQSKPARFLVDVPSHGNILNSEAI